VGDTVSSRTVNVKQSHGHSNTPISAADERATL
jgi:hypothetical protein